MNSVQILGRLTSDPELRRTQSGISTCKFTVAVNRKFKNKNGEYEADFISCMAWKEKAEFISRYWSKGKMIAIEGELRTGSYQDKHHQDVTHYTTDVIVDKAYFCGDKSDNNQNPNIIQQAQQAGIPTETYNSLSDFEEILSVSDVPF